MRERAAVEHDLRLFVRPRDDVPHRSQRRRLKHVTMTSTHSTRLTSAHTHTHTKYCTQHQNKAAHDVKTRICQTISTTNQFNKFLQRVSFTSRLVTVTNDLNSDAFPHLTFVTPTDLDFDLLVAQQGHEVGHDAGVDHHLDLLVAPVREVRQRPHRVHQNLQPAPTRAPCTATIQCARAHTHTLHAASTRTAQSPFRVLHVSTLRT